MWSRLQAFVFRITKWQVERVKPEALCCVTDTRWTPLLLRFVDTTVTRGLWTSLSWNSSAAAQHDNKWKVIHKSHRVQQCTCFSGRAFKKISLKTHEAEPLSQVSCDVSFYSFGQRLKRTKLLLFHSSGGKVKVRLQNKCNVIVCNTENWLNCTGLQQIWM